MIGAIVGKNCCRSISGVSFSFITILVSFWTQLLNISSLKTGETNEVYGLFDFFWCLNSMFLVLVWDNLKHSSFKEGIIVSSHLSYIRNDWQLV